MRNGASRDGVLRALGNNYSKERAAKDGWADGFRVAQKHSRWPTPNSAMSLTEWKKRLQATDGSVTLHGAGWTPANGEYVRDGQANGAPKYKHTDGELWIRHSMGTDGWVLSPRDGNSAWTTVYTAPVTPKRPHLPPASGWRLGKNWSEARAVKDRWQEAFAGVETREPPPGSRSSTPLASPVVIGTVLLDTTSGATDDTDVGDGSCSGGCDGDGGGGDGAGTGTTSTLAEMVALARYELDIPQHVPVKQVLHQACIALGVDAADRTIMEQAAVCHRLLAGGGPD